MANEKNLVYNKGFDSRTTEEQSAIARKGGIASGKARREKATMRKTLEKMLDETYKNTGMTYRDMATLGLIKGAVKGNAQNYKTIMEVLGELVGQDENNKSNGILTDLVEALSNAKKS